MKYLASLLLSMLACLCLADSLLAQGNSAPGPGWTFGTFGDSATSRMEGLGETDDDGNFIQEGDHWIQLDDGSWQKDGKWRRSGRDIVTFIPFPDEDLIAYTFHGAAVSKNKFGLLSCVNPEYNSDWVKK